jgi:hypothetical protein
MTEREANAKIEYLATIGITAIAVIVIFGKTDDAHVYAVRHVSYN